MVGSLGPVVHGATHSIRRTIALHTSGLLLGSVLTASMLIALGRISHFVASGYLSRIALGAALASTLYQVAGGRVVESRRQVPEAWRRILDMDVLAFTYGLILGLGLFTAVVIAGFWVFVAATLLVPPAVAYGGWATYALARGIGFGVAIRRRQGDPHLLTRVHRRIVVASATAVAIGGTVPIIVSFHG